MNAADFLDTNVLVYAYDDGQAKKQSIARGYLRKAVAGEFVISVQVLAELASTLLHRFSPPATTETVIRILDLLSPVPLVQPDMELVRRAVQAKTQYGIHFYDGMIVAAAERSGCGRIWSEDLNAGQEYFGVKVENPFA
jgi:predicted nucleic acid-binding protein